MAFTREFIRKAAKESGVELPKELEDALVQEHISARDAYAKAQVESALEANKPEAPPKVKDTEEYKTLKKQFDDYKAEQEGKETKAAKEKAVRAYYESKGIMAAGAFVQGSSIELSADGPIRPPYAVYFQGGLTWYHAKLGILMSLQKLCDAGLVQL